MKKPTISQAHTLCAALGARGVIVLAFSRDNVAGASYGETKAECGQLGYTLDRIIEHLCDGRIPMWTTRADDEARARRTLREGIQDGTYCPGCRQPKGDCDCDEASDQRVDERFDDTRDLIARLIQQRDEFAGALLDSIAHAWETKSRIDKGQCPHDRLGLWLLSDPQGNAGKIMRAHDMKIIEPLLNTLETLRPHVRDMYIHVPGEGTDTAGHLIDMAIVTAVSEGE